VCDHVAPWDWGLGTGYIMHDPCASLHTPKFGRCAILHIHKDWLSRPMILVYPENTLGSVQICTLPSVRLRHQVAIMMIVRT